MSQPDRIVQAFGQGQLLEPLRRKGHELFAQVCQREHVAFNLGFAWAVIDGFIVVFEFR
jgi:hypothetical protein